MSNKGFVSTKSLNSISEKENLKKNLMNKKSEVLKNAFNDDDDGNFNIYLNLKFRWQF
mgnify:CR=1 FL=1